MSNPVPPQPLDPTTRVYVAGHRGLVGSAVWRTLEARGFSDLVGVTSAELDLRDRGEVDAFFDRTRPQVVIDAAAKVGGILANATYPADFISDNLRIQVNLLDAAVRTGVGRFLFLGSTCIYPKHAPQPITEDSLLTGPLEETNDAYAIAKISGVLQVQAIRRQHGLPYISAMPTNLYGPGDNFSPTGAHVLPAMIRRFHEAVRDGAREVVCWGTGNPRRELLHADDVASAAIFLLEHYDDDAPINIGLGDDVSVRELAETVADVVGYTGAILWDPTKPDGTPRKLVAVDRINSLGWKASISLRDGIESTYRWYVEHQHGLRG